MSEEIRDFRLSVEARRRILCELADLYMAEADANDRPITEGLSAFLPNLIGGGVDMTAAIAFFDRFARARHLLGVAREDDVDQLERRAERLLDRLVGEEHAA